MVVTRDQNAGSGLKAYNDMINYFQVSVTHTPVTRVLNNDTGQETFTDGTSVTIQGSFWRHEDSWNKDTPGQTQNADAILVTKSTVSVSKDDKITYDSQTYRVHSVKPRQLDGTVYYNISRLFKI